MRPAICIAACAACVLSAFGFDGGTEYLVLVDGGASSPYYAAGQALAEFHGGQAEEWASGSVKDLPDLLRARSPKFVVFVLPPEKIDVELAHAILTYSTRLDDDPFLDFE